MKIKTLVNNWFYMLNTLNPAYGGLILALFYATLALSNTVFPENITDFTKAYFAGGQAVWNGKHEALTLLIRQALFTNIPVVAYLFAPLSEFDSWVAGRIFTIVMILATAASYVLIVHWYAPKHQISLFVLFLANGPLWYCLQLGNTTNAILFLLIVTLALWERKKHFLAGMILGVCLVIKPFLMLLGLFFLVRRQWSVVFGAATVGVVTVALSVYLFGLQMNLDWYQYCIAAFSGHPMGAFNVQSLGGFLMRLQTGRNFLWDWAPRELSQELAYTHTFLIIGTIAAGFWLIVSKLKTDPDQKADRLNSGDYLAFSIVIVMSLICSTVSWTHYYLLLLLVFGFYLGGKLPLPNDRFSHLLAISSIIFCSFPLIEPYLGYGWWERQIARSLVSLHLLGGLLMLTALMRGAYYYGKVKVKDPTFTRIIKAA